MSAIYHIIEPTTFIIHHGVLHMHSLIQDWTLVVGLTRDQKRQVCSYFLVPSHRLNPDNFCFPYRMVSMVPIHHQHKAR